ncbi:MAG: acyl-CoA mutase large subunit family protein [Acidobacteriota bacterium]
MKEPSIPKITYRPEDTSFLDYTRDLGDPGEFPFARGIHPQMYRERLWTMRQYAGYAGAEESNRRYRYLLSQGTTGLSVAFDLPTQIGLDSDDPLAGGEVGRVGVAIDSLQDMERLLETIPLDEVSTSMTINATASILLALYLAVAKKRGIGWARLRGTVQNDILKEYIARGTYIYPPEASLRIITDVFAFCSKEVPLWNMISISGYHIREAGSTAAQEIAFTLGNAATYVEAALAAGLKIDEFAPRLSFFFSTHNNLFEEIAKFRAARRLWARLMHEKGARDQKSLMLRVHAQTAGSTLTAQQPENNVVRVAFQALASVLGGVQSLHTNSRDEALALPTEASVRLALRTQQILACESGVDAVVDPLGGSWYIEKLTADLEGAARDYLDQIRSRGGMLRAIETGYVHAAIQQSAYEQQRRVESGEQVVVGVNRFQEEDKARIEILRIAPEVERRQVERLKLLRDTRRSEDVERALAQLRRAAAGTENLMPPIIAAVESHATVGEIAGSLREVFGEHQETVVI